MVARKKCHMLTAIKGYIYPAISKYCFPVAKKDCFFSERLSILFINLKKNTIAKKCVPPKKNSLSILVRK